MADAEDATEFTPELTTIIIGEPGMGKSTMVYNLAGRPQLEGERTQLDGTDAKGVTKTFETFKVDLRGEGFKDGALDTPGLGDQEIKLTQWLAQAERCFQTVDAIIICVSETNPRITMGAELVSLMVANGFLSTAKADNPKYKKLMKNSIILVGTKGNCATKKMRRAMPGVADLFAEKAGLKDVGVTYIPVDAGDWEEPDEYEETPVLDLSKLQAHFRGLAGQILREQSGGVHIEYKMVDATELIGWANDILGLRLTDEQKRQMAKELGFWRNAVGAIVNACRGRFHLAKKAGSRMVISVWSGLCDLGSALLDPKYTYIDTYDMENDYPYHYMH